MSRVSKQAWGDEPPPPASSSEPHQARRPDGSVHAAGPVRKKRALPSIDVVRAHHPQQKAKTQPQQNPQQQKLASETKPPGSTPLVQETALMSNGHHHQMAKPIPADLNVPHGVELNLDSRPFLGEDVITPTPRPVRASVTESSSKVDDHDTPRSQKKKSSFDLLDSSLDAKAYFGLSTDGPVIRKLVNKGESSSMGMQLIGGSDTKYGAIFIDNVADGSLAQQVGLQAGDRVLAINGHGLITCTNSEATLIAKSIGTALDLTVQRLSFLVWSQVRVKTGSSPIKKRTVFFFRSLDLPISPEDSSASIRTSQLLRPSLISTKGPTLVVRILTSELLSLKIGLVGGHDTPFGGIFVKVENLMHLDDSFSDTKSVSLPDSDSASSEPKIFIPTIDTLRYGDRILEINKHSLVELELPQVFEFINPNITYNEITLQRLGEEQFDSLFSELLSEPSALPVMSPLEGSRETRLSSSSLGDPSPSTVIDFTPATPSLDPSFLRSSFDKSSKPVVSDRPNMTATPKFEALDPRDAALLNRMETKSQSSPKPFTRNLTTPIEPSIVEAIGKPTQGSLRYLDHSVSDSSFPKLQHQKQSISGNTDSTASSIDAISHPLGSDSLSRKHPQKSKIRTLSIKELESRSSLSLFPWNDHVIVSQVNSPSLKSKGLSPGDCIVSVNGIDMTGKNPTQVMETLEFCGTDLRLAVLHEPHSLDVLHDTSPRKIVLHNTAKRGFGFNVVVPDGVAGPVLISSMDPKGLVALSGLANIGDQIVKINGRYIHSATKTEVIELLSSQANPFKMTIQRNPKAWDAYMKFGWIPRSSIFMSSDFVPKGKLVRVVVNRNQGEAFGFRFAGEKESHLGGAFVDHITQDSPAGKAGLQVGDRLVAVDDKGVLLADHDHVLRLLSSSPPSCGLTVLRFGEAQFSQLAERANLEMKTTNEITITSLNPLRTSAVESTGELLVVEIEAENNKAGFTVAGGEYSKLGAVFVTGVDQNSVAGRFPEPHRHLQLGDRLLEVNGYTLLNSSQDDAKKRLKTSLPRLHLTIQRLGADQWRSISEAAAIGEKEDSDKASSNPPSGLNTPVRASFSDMLPSPPMDSLKLLSLHGNPDSPSLPSSSLPHGSSSLKHPSSTPLNSLPTLPSEPGTSPPNTQTSPSSLLASAFRDLSDSELGDPIPLDVKPRRSSSRTIDIEPIPEEELVDSSRSSVELHVAPHVKLSLPGSDSPLQHRKPVSSVLPDALTVDPTKTIPQSHASSPPQLDPVGHRLNTTPSPLSQRKFSRDPLLGGDRPVNTILIRTPSDRFTSATFSLPLATLVCSPLSHYPIVWGIDRDLSSLETPSFQLGDEIVEVGGVSCYDLDLSGMKNLLSQKSSDLSWSELDIHVQRTGEILRKIRIPSALRPRTSSSSMKTSSSNLRALSGCERFGFSCMLGHDDPGMVLVTAVSRELIKKNLIHLGDQIVEINERPLFGLERDEIESLFSSSPGEEISLVVISNMDEWNGLLNSELALIEPEIVLEPADKGSLGTVFEVSVERTNGKIGIGYVCLKGTGVFVNNLAFDHLKAQLAIGDRILMAGPHTFFAFETKNEFVGETLKSLDNVVLTVIRFAQPPSSQSKLNFDSVRCGMILTFKIPSEIVGHIGLCGGFQSALGGIFINKLPMNNSWLEIGDRVLAVGSTPLVTSSLSDAAGLVKSVSRSSVSSPTLPSSSSTEIEFTVLRLPQRHLESAFVDFKATKSSAGTNRFKTFARTLMNLNRAKTRKERTVSLVNKGSGYGFTIAVDKRNPADIFISNVKPGSEADGKLKVGDQLWEINGVLIETLTFVEASAMIKQSMRNLELVVQLNPNDWEKMKPSAGKK